MFNRILKSIRKSIVAIRNLICTRSVHMNANSKVNPVSRNGITPSVTKIEHSIDEVIKRMGKNSILSDDSISSGFRDLDIMTSGFQKGNLIVVGGRPAMGKTAFAMNIAQHVGVINKIPIVYFSLEMPNEELVQRMLSYNAKVGINKISAGDLSRDDWSLITSAAGRLAESPIFITDKISNGITELCDTAHRTKEKHDIKLIVIDGLQLLIDTDITISRQQEAPNIFWSLKKLANELQVPVLTTSQLSRKVESRIECRPHLTDLRESSAIEKNADIVMLLHSEEDCNPTDETRCHTEIIIAKNKKGPTGVCDLTFLQSCMRFEGRN
jgi:replicative DNA helicase